MNYKEVLETIRKSELEVLIKYPILKLDGKVVKKRKLSEFLTILINEYLVNYRTLSAETNVLTDVKNLHRSTKDIFLITKYYFPKVKLEKVIYTLCDLMNDSKISILRCTNIGQHIWFSNNCPKRHINYGWNVANQHIDSKLNNLTMRDYKTFYDKYETKNK